MRIGITALGAVACAVLAGCGGLKVHKGQATEPSELKGIPFYAKVPQCQHETKRRSHTLVVTMTAQEPDSSGQPTPISMTVRIPDTAAALEALKTQVSINSSLGMRFRASVTSAMDRLKNQDVMRSGSEILSNSWETKMVTGSQRYYIESRTPLFGTANATFKFDAEGTLTEATSNVADKTAETLLGIFPLSDKLSVQWGLKAGAQKLISGDGSEKAAPDRAFIVNVTGEPSQTIDVLRRVYGGEKYAKSPCTTPSDSSLVKALTEVDGSDTQLISKTEVDKNAKAPAAAASKDAYIINGSIALPKP